MAGLNDFPGFISDIVQGSTRDFTITVQRTVAGVTSAVDLTGAKFYVSFAYDRDVDTAPELVIEIDPPTDPLNGKTIGRVPGASSLLLNVGKIYYSVRMISAAGFPYVVDYAKIKILAGISDQVS